ncbi:MAG: hypothetical protein GY769_25230 [bacterium]|nr:hypothetical protein [bacterium]
MRAFTAVFIREIGEHRLVFLIAGFLALISLLAPLLSTTNDSARDVREATAMALALSYALILAVVLGATGIASELAAGRQSFFFSRPIGAGTLLSAKLAAALVLVAGGGLLAATPATPRLAELASDWGGVGLGTGRGFGATEATLVAAFAIGALLLVLGSAHYLSLALRARDAWLAVDLAWLAILAALGFWSHSQLESAFASSLWKWILGLCLLLLIPAVLVSWLLQIARGRTDLARSHRWMSAVLGCLSLTIGSWLAISAYRASHPEPTDVWALDHVQSGIGQWLYLKGATSWSFKYQPSFFWNTATSDFIRLNSAQSVTLTKDGSKALWLARSDPRAMTSDLYSMDLTAPEPLRVKSPVSIPVPRIGRRFLSVSPTGSLVAVCPHGQQLRVIDVGSGVQVLAQKLERGLLRGAVFRDSQTLQLLRQQMLIAEPDLDGHVGANEQVFLVDTIDIQTGNTRSTVTEPLAQHARSRWFPQGQTLISGPALVDLATGKVLVDFNSDTSDEWNTLDYRFLSDGRIIGYDQSGENATLRLYDRSGKSLRRFELGRTGYVWIGGQASRDELFITIHTGDRTKGRRHQSRSSWASRVLDLKDGSIRDLGFFYSMSKPEDPPGARSTSLFSDANDSLYERERDGSYRQLTRGRRVRGGRPGMGLLPDISF